MKIKSLIVEGLRQRSLNLTITFHEDLNIITGRNGSGKTSIMKLLWYMMSGNVRLAVDEVAFKTATLETTEYKMTLSRQSPDSYSVELVDGTHTLSFRSDRSDERDYATESIAMQAAQKGQSIFFPTFRRIEGGFTLSSSAARIARSRAEIDESLIGLSRRLSNPGHRFVCALSTSDVEQLLVRHYTELSEEASRLQAKVSQDIINQIKDFQTRHRTEAIDANNTIAAILKKIEDMEQRRETTLQPANAVREIVMSLFDHLGISFGRSLKFGDAAQAINADTLSAGEKQILSFVAYNAVFSNNTILIDEPELSLHVDWQRRLFSLLESQQSSNQFIVATHSPFIYSKYPEREIVIDSDRGDTAPEKRL